MTPKHYKNIIKENLPEINEIEAAEKINLLQLVVEENLNKNALDYSACDLKVDSSVIGKKVPETKKISSDFAKNLAVWGATFKVKQNALDKLLRILKEEFPNYDLPNNGKVLLQTPKKCKTDDMPPGRYYHFGMESELRLFLLLSQTQYTSSTINLQIHVDGIPVSDDQQLWPILARIVPDGYIFIIGCYLGETKPRCSNNFLLKFVNEAKYLIENRISFNGRLLNIIIECIICDTLACIFILKTKYHTGYDSCSRCTIKEDHIPGRLCFPLHMERRNRKDTDFDKKIKNFDQDPYREGYTVLSEIPNLGLVFQVPLEYMHLLCLGVMKKLIHVWSKGPRSNRILNAENSCTISKYLKSIKLDIPQDFARIPREIRKYNRWKATELRLFLLYTGPVALLSIEK